MDGLIAWLPKLGTQFFGTDRFGFTVFDEWRLCPQEIWRRIDRASRSHKERLQGDIIFDYARYACPSLASSWAGKERSPAGKDLDMYSKEYYGYVQVMVDRIVFEAKQAMGGYAYIEQGESLFKLFKW